MNAQNKKPSPFRSLPKASPVKVSKPARFRKPWIITLILVILIAIGGGFYAYRHHQNDVKTEQAYQADKVRFAQVEKDMRTVRDTFVQTLGKPTQEKVTKTCSHTSVKYATGTLYCSVDYAIGYTLEGEQGYVAQARNAESVFNESAYELTSHSLESYDLSLSKNQPAELKFNGGDKDTTCSLYTEYTNPEYRDDFRGMNASNAALYYFHCSRVVEKPIYTLAE